MTTFALPDQEGRCPHCGTLQQYTAHAGSSPPVPFGIVEDSTTTQGQGRSLQRVDLCRKAITVARCRNCKEPVIDLLTWKDYVAADKWLFPEMVVRLYPRRSNRPLVPAEVPTAIREWYEEAAAAEVASPRGGAALARACLQMALRDQGFTGKTLYDEIEMARKNAKVAALTLGQKLHIVRVVGNYSVHPTEDSLGALLTVETEELDALFAALQEFFEVFYVGPKRHQATVDALNAKLKAAGKNPIT